MFAGTLTNRAQTLTKEATNIVAKVVNYRTSGQLTRGGLSHGAYKRLVFLQAVSASLTN